MIVEGIEASTNHATELTQRQIPLFIFGLSRSSSGNNRDFESSKVEEEFT